VELVAAKFPAHVCLWNAGVVHRHTHDRGHHAGAPFAPAERGADGLSPPCLRRFGWVTREGSDQG